MHNKEADIQTVHEDQRPLQTTELWFVLHVVLSVNNKTPCWCDAAEEEQKLQSPEENFLWRRSVPPLICESVPPPPAGGDTTVRPFTSEGEPGLYQKLRFYIMNNIIK